VQSNEKEARAVSASPGQTHIKSVAHALDGVRPNSIPLEMRERDQWVLFCWEAEDRHREDKVLLPKATKAPYRVGSNGKRLASTTNPSTWSSYEAALADKTALHAACHIGVYGIGYVFTADDPYLGGDLDDCVEGATVHPDAQAVIDKLGGYAELSPTTDGVKVIVRASLNGFPRHKTPKTPWGGVFEVYDQGRFFTITGHALTECNEIPDRQAEVEEVLGQMFPPEPEQNPRTAPSPAQAVNLSDQDLLGHAFANPVNGADIERLWNGDSSRYASPSEADCALANHLLYMTGGDEARADALFRQSGLMRPKWNRDDYRTKTIAKAGLGLRIDTRFGQPVRAVSTPTSPEAFYELGGRSFSHAELLAADFPPPQFLVDNLIERGTLGTIAALPEMWKSWLAVELAHKIAVGGGEFLGREVQTCGPVGYWWQDDSSGNMAARVRQYTELHGFTGELPIRWNLNRGLILPRGIDLLREEIEREEQVLVVLDSLYNFALGMELKGEEVAALYARLKAEVCDPTGCTILTIDHAPWPTEGNRGQSRALGSVFKRAAVRWGIYLGRDGKGAFLEASGNNVAGLKRHIATFDEDALEVRLTAMRSREETARRVTELREENPAITQGEVAEQLEMTERTVRKYWHEDEESGQESLLGDGATGT